MVSGMANNVIKKKSAWQLMVMLWKERFLPFVKMICTGTEI